MSHQCPILLFMVLKAAERLRTAAADLLAEVNTGAASTDELRKVLDTTRSVTAAVNAAQTAAAELIARRERHGDGGAEVLASSAGLSQREAHAQVATAAALQKVPELRDAVQAGTVPQANARRLAEAITKTGPEAVAGTAGLLAQAESMRPEQFARTAQRWIGAQQADDGTAEYLRQRARRYLKMYDTDDGMIALHGEFDKVTGTCLRNRLSRTASKLLDADKKLPESQRRKFPQCMADALQHYTTRTGAGCDQGESAASSDGAMSVSTGTGRGHAQASRSTDTANNTDHGDGSGCVCAQASRSTGAEANAGAAGTGCVCAQPSRSAGAVSSADRDDGSGCGCAQPSLSAGAEANAGAAGTGCGCARPSRSAGAVSSADRDDSSGCGCARPSRSTNSATRNSTGNTHFTGTGAANDSNDDAATGADAAGSSTGGGWVADITDDHPGRPGQTAEGGTGGDWTADITVLAHVDDATGELIAELSDGSKLPPAALDALSCNARWTGLVFDRAGDAIWRSRSRRTVTDTQWQALFATYGGCFHCGAPAGMCQAHHITPYSQGGATSLDNLIMVCWNCHHRIHHHNWQIHEHPDGSHSLHPPDDPVTQPRYGPACADDPAPQPPRTQTRTRNRDRTSARARDPALW